ncbi:SusD/RagB family nutrient-binding outer membrane lipoprotein [Phocaeicola oris]|uniref:SusD/RagB family nutrient-binding outer membrane lipoprotein n=1 Tax=Phocaeicola oris TaxID=2896850 RepID=UPI00234E5682|nr:SusD/RagB family nutrient-binding outer membrane lipoprotein [Phocaeicola oris]MCE2617020.1 SusD/RagB family nutrient-binding outer membrane lipoprotein [Phocaeicola oris]
MKSIFKTIALSASMMFMLSACTSDFEEINTDPDAFTSAPYTNMLGYVITEGMQQWGTSLDVCQWAGYVSEVQYLNNYEGYTPTNNTYGNRWYNSYWGYTQLQDIIDRIAVDGASEDYKQMRDVAMLWQNYLMYNVANAFGPIPYSEAFKGKEGVLQSKYDSDEVVLKAVLENLKTIADSFANGYTSSDYGLGIGDFLFTNPAVGKGLNKDDAIKKWQKFCNSLRLRIAMRIVNKAPEITKATCEEIFNNPTQYPYVQSIDDQVYFWWQGTRPYFEPWYNNSVTRDDDGMADIFIDHLKKMNDPRLFVYAKPAKTDGEYRGYENGASLNPANIHAISRIGAMFRDNASGFSPLYKASETYYMMAEAALRGWNVPMSAEEAYNKGVLTSMAENEVSDENAKAYLEGPGKFDGSFDMLYFEQWVSMFKEGIEAWSLYRRTGFPTYIHSSISAPDDKGKVYPKYPGARSAYKGIHNDVPFRFPYPNNQFSYNRANVTEASQGIENYVWGKQVWWDTRTDVH